MTIMEPVIQNQTPIFSVAALAFTGSSLTTEVLFKQPIMLENIKNSLAEPDKSGARYHTQSHYAMNYKLSALSFSPFSPSNRQLGPLNRIVIGFPTHTSPLSHFVRVCHGCKSEANNGQNSHAYCPMGAGCQETLDHLRRAKQHLHPRTLRQQTVRFGSSNHTTASNNTSFRCFSGPMAAEMDQKSGRRHEKLAEAF